MARQHRTRVGAPVVLGSILSAALLLTACTAGVGQGVEPPAGADRGLSGRLTVFAAASLTASFDELAGVFQEQNPGVSVRTVYDGSSTLATQLIEGAGADVFASADEATMARVSEAGLLDGPPHVFASNTLVIIVAPGNPLRIHSLADVAAPDRLVVLCAPMVPCGAASERLLDLAGVRVTPVSEEQNVTAVLTKVALGEADAGLVYATDGLAAAGRVDVLPAEHASEVVNRYLIACPAGGVNRAAADGFIELVLSETGQKILARNGFGAP